MSEGIFDQSSERYWDYISTLTPSESQETLKDLFQESFIFLKPLLDELYWVDANYLYMNMVCNVPQSRVAEISGVSQFGVSKRVSTALKKVRNLLLKPEKDINMVRKHLGMIVNKKYIETAVIYYQVKTFSMTARIMDTASEGTTRIRVLNLVTDMDELAVQEEPDKVTEVIKKIDPPMGAKVLEAIKQNPDHAELITSMAKRYLDYYKVILSVGYYSDFAFKKFDGERNQA